MRFGEPKQLAMLGGETLLERAIRTAMQAGCDPVYAVLGWDAEGIAARCRLNPAMVVLNDAWREGMGSSVRAGVGALSQQVEGLILMTCDQPAVSAEHLRRLIGTAEEGGGREAISSAYAGRCGVPAFIPAARFAALRDLRGDRGARSLLVGSQSVELPGGELDIDTGEDMTAARRIFDSAAVDTGHHGGPTQVG
jgi:CTP:molybdopterin cytidylyltransferase MocA